MPNSLAYLVVFGSPLAVLLMFRTLSVPVALACAVLGGYLLLPTGVGIDLPLLPAFDKTLFPSLAALVCCLMLARSAAGPGGSGTVGSGMGGSGMGSSGTVGSGTGGATRSGRIVAGLLVLALATPALTVLRNADPVIAGPTFIPGLRVYDIFSMVSNTLVTLLPFLLARRILAAPANQTMLLRAFVVAGLGYSVLCLIEVRLSPQLNVWLYGFFPHAFEQHMRAGGFRPIVFLQHGLWVGIFMATTVLAAAALWRQERATGSPGAGRWLMAAAWLLGVLMLVKAVGALAITLVLLPVVLLAGVRLQLVVAGIVALTVLFYPMLRGAGLIPVDRIAAIARSFSADRAGSLQFRLENEDGLLARANLRPLAGWGGWGRPRLYDSVTGKDTSITDGMWIILIGGAGWAGYLAQFGLLAAPVLLAGLRAGQQRGRQPDVQGGDGPGDGISPATAGLALMLAANMIDLIPNATLTPVTWLMAGAIMGRVGHRWAAVQPVVAGSGTARSGAAQQPGEAMHAPRPAGGIAALPVQRRPRTAVVPVSQAGSAQAGSAQVGSAQVGVAPVPALPAAAAPDPAAPVLTRVPRAVRVPAPSEPQPRQSRG